MAQPGNKGGSELDPTGRLRSHQRTHPDRFQMKSWQDFANDPNGSWTHQGDSMERNGIAIEKATSWQDHPGPFENTPDGRWPRQEDQIRPQAGAKVQTLPWQNHPGPYDNSPDGSWSNYREPKGHNLSADVQTLSWQDHPGPFKNVPKRNQPNQSERIEQHSAVIEKTALWQDHPGSPETVPNGSGPHQDNQAGENAGAVMQTSGQDYAWPSPVGNWPHPEDQRERATHPEPFEDNFTHAKFLEQAAPACLPYRQWTQRVRDQGTHPTPVAPKELQFFNPKWAPDPPAQNTAPTSTHESVHPSTKHKTAHEAIQAHLGITQGQGPGQNSSNGEEDASQPVVEEYERKTPKVSIPRRQCYSESNPGTFFRNGIPPLAPVASTYENGHHGAAQEDKDKDIPTVRLPGKDCYEDQFPDCCSGEFKANGARRPGE